MGVGGELENNHYDFENPVKSSEEFFGSKALIAKLEDYVKRPSLNVPQNFLLAGPRKSGKTSFLNALPTMDVTKGFIPVQIKLELPEENQEIPLVRQIFGAVLYALVRGGCIESSNVYYTGWRMQVDKGVLELPMGSELLRSGAKIAYALSHWTEPRHFDSQIFREDWLELDRIATSAFPDFKGFFLLFEEDTYLERSDPSIIDLFFRIVNSRDRGIAVFATSGKSAKKRIQEKTYYELLKTRLVPVGQELVLRPFSFGDVLDMVESAQKMKLVSFEEKFRVAWLVRRATSGHPNLVKMFLSHIYDVYVQTGTYHLASEVYKTIVNQLRFNLDLDSDRSFQRLEELRLRDRSLFSTVTKLVLSTTNISLGNPRDESKTLEQILRLKYSPAKIDDDAFERELRKFVEDARLLWGHKLIHFRDVDGREVQYSTEAEIFVVDKNSKPFSNMNEMLRSYLWVFAREDGQVVNSSISSHNYLYVVADGFVTELAKYLAITIDASEDEDNYIVRSEATDVFDEQDRDLGRIVDNAIAESSVAHFLRPGSEGTTLSAFHGNLFKITARNAVRFWHFRVLVSEISMLEVMSFSIVFRCSLESDFAFMRARLQDWLTTHAATMAESYNLSFREESLREIPPEFMDEICFLLNRREKFLEYLALFDKSKVEELKALLVEEVPRQIAMSEMLKGVTHLEGEWRSQAHETGYLCAYVGEFELAKSCFSFAHKPQSSQLIMIEDNKCVVGASIGDFQSALVHAKYVLSLLSTTSILEEYWKLIYVPFAASKRVAGANSIAIKNFDHFYYEIQLGTLLLQVNKDRPLSEADRSLLANLDKELTEERVVALQMSTDPIHRILAGYLFLSGRPALAKSVLETFMARGALFPAVQIEAATLELIEIQEALSAS
jgi:hypothetical protein